VFEEGSSWEANRQDSPLLRGQRMSVTASNSGSIEFGANYASSFLNISGFLITSRFPPAGEARDFLERDAEV